MAIQKVTYEDKVDLKIWASIPNTNKIKADDMNEIKGAINENADELSSAKDMVASQDSENEALMNALPSETQEGENINIKGTIPVKFKEFKVSGNSKQETSDAMPSPEYPSEIQNVEGNVNITKANKNLAKIANINKDYIINNNNGTFTVNGSLELNDNFRFIDTLFLPAGDYRISLGIDYNKFNNSYYNITANGEQIKYFNRTDIDFELKEASNINVTIVLVAGTYDNLLVKPIIEKTESEVSSDWVPHQEQTVTFPLAEGQKLMQGDYLADDGIHHKRKQIELDGTDFSLYSNQVSGRTIYLISNFSNNNNFKTYDSSILCNILKQGTSSQGDNYLNNNGSSGDLYVSIENSILGITDESTNEEKLQAFQNLIAETGFVYEGELAEEETEAYTEEQQEAYNQLKQLKAYEEETNIYSTNSTSPIFNVTAIKNANAMYENLNSKIENIIELLSTTATSAMLLENMQSDLESEVM